VSLSQLSQSSWSVPGEVAWWLRVLLPHLAAVVVERAEVRGDLVCIWARAEADGAACPRCGRWCSDEHCRYTRTLRDAGIGGRRVLIRLLVRVLRCGNGGCATGTFAEQPAGLAGRYARRTPPAARQLAAVAAALAGRAGSRLAGVLAVEVSRCTLIRMLAAVPDPPPGLVRVLGVDDFSLRRGRTYATLLVDMESGAPVDVLPDREAATLAAWLREHPGVQVICRDRATAYAQAARDAAPGAAQVADRWHLWHNLCEHAGKAVARHQDCISAAAAAGQQPGHPAPGPGLPADLEAVITGRHLRVQQMRAAGQTLAQAAAVLGLTRQVTGRFWRAGDAGTLLAASTTSALDPYKPYLRQRWDQGITSIRALHREITTAGYHGCYKTTYRYARLFRLAAPPRPPAPPAARQVTSWILTRPARLDPGEHAQLTALRGCCPEIDALTGHVAAFAAILTGRHGSRLDAWLAAVDASPAQPDLHSFTAGIRQDHAAVRNALTLPWNSGRIEGLNTRTKLLKRQMYGRAAFPLLRKRILLTSTNTSP
jgi:transposase